MGSPTILTGLGAGQQAAGRLRGRIRRRRFLRRRGVQPLAAGRQNVRAAPATTHTALANKAGVRGSPSTRWLWATPNTGESSNIWLAAEGLIRASACDQHQ